MDQESEDRRFAQVRAGGPAGRAALWHLLDSAMPEIWYFIRARIPDDTDAEELTRTVVHAVIKVYDGGTDLRLEHGRSSLFAYLVRSARREVARYTNRRRLGVAIPTDDLESALADPALGPAEAAGTREFWQWVHEALRLLNPRDCTLVYCAFRLELTGPALAQAAGLSGHSNISVAKARALKRFVDRLAAVWVARSAGTLGCAGLQAILGADRTIAPGRYDAVAAHLGTCPVCGAEADTIRLARSGDAVLRKFRTLPLLPVPAALQDWLNRQRDADQDRRRTLIEIVTGWFSRPVAAPAAVLPGPDAPPGFVDRGRDRLRSAVAGVTRQPAVSAVVQTAQQHPGAVAAAGTATAVVVAVVAGVLTSTPSSDAAATPGVGITSASASSATPEPPVVATTASPTASPPSTAPPVPTTTTRQPTPGPTTEPPTTTAAPPVVAAAPTTCAPGWAGVTMPAGDPGANRLSGIAATGPDDVWVVGATGTRSLLMHFDGHAWRTYPSPNPGTASNVVRAVATRSRTDAWAVGQGDDGRYTFALHWDGSAWTEHPLPAGIVDWTVLLTATDVWLLGYQHETKVRSDAAVLRWTGTGWTELSVPSPANGLNLLRAAVAVGSEVLAVGGDYGGDPLLAHGNGPTWTNTVWPAPPGVPVVLHDIAATAADDLWVAGDRQVAGRWLPFASHWDGTRWTTAALPDIGPGTIESVLTLAHDDVWLLGTAGREWVHGEGRSLALHWDGRAWTDVSPDTPGGRYLDATRIGEHEFLTAGYVSRSTTAADEVLRVDRRRCA
ncbi:RNA polymerase sigma factor [Dactylosporangium sp. NPDC051541]|uniref:RNA polymerase sigma factor n=1 Tax=Dactylosporangium sp. NPDC051541 TaxID=3363977 RepID=UPI00379AD5F9